MSDEMHVQQEGLGYCSKHATPILSQVGIKGSRICFACQEDAKEKTGRTVVVREDKPDANGRVTITDVKTMQETIGDATPMQSVQAIGEVVVSLTIAQLVADPVRSLLQGAYDAIDNMPPFKTLKETKQAIAVQEVIQELLVPKRVRRHREGTKEDASEAEQKA